MHAQLNIRHTGIQSTRGKVQHGGKLWKCSLGLEKHVSDHTAYWGHRPTETEVPGIKAAERDELNEMW